MGGEYIQAMLIVHGFAIHIVITDHILKLFNDKLSGREQLELEPLLSAHQTLPQEGR